MYEEGLLHQVPQDKPRLSRAHKALAPITETASKPVYWQLTTGNSSSDATKLVLDLQARDQK